MHGMYRTNFFQGPLKFSCAHNLSNSMVNRDTHFSMGCLTENHLISDPIWPFVYMDFLYLQYIAFMSSESEPCVAIKSLFNVRCTLFGHSKSTVTANNILDYKIISKHFCFKFQFHSNANSLFRRLCDHTHSVMSQRRRLLHLGLQLRGR